MTPCRTVQGIPLHVAAGYLAWRLKRAGALSVHGVRCDSEQVASALVEEIRRQMHVPELMESGAECRIGRN
jgi:hypothetical protein